MEFEEGRTMSRSSATERISIRVEPGLKASAEQVDKEIAESQALGLPVARYDAEQRRPYLEYPDGRRDYGVV